MRTSALIFLLVVLVLSCDNSHKSLEELNIKSVMLGGKGRYSEATKVAEEALTVAENTFGPDHIRVAPSLNILAALYRVQGKYIEAEALLKGVLKIWEKALGPDHPVVLATLENMADLYEKIGKQDEAERLKERARRIRSNQ